MPAALVFVALTALQPSPCFARSALESFGPFVLPFGTLDGLEIVIETDLGVVAPRLQELQADEPLVRGIFSQDSVLALGREAGWGHAAPFLLSATYDALGRLSTSLLFETAVLADGKPLFAPRALPENSLRLSVIGNPELFTLKASTSHAGSDGYWNPRTNEIGVFLDSTIMALARQVDYAETPEARSNAVAILKGFTARRLIGKAGHELYHAIQSQSDDESLLFPLLSEGTALHAQDNLLGREELMALIPAMAGAAARLSTPEEAERQCEIGGMGGSLQAVPRMVRAHEAMRRRQDLSITALLALDYGDFSDAQENEVADRYALAYAFVFFLKNLAEAEVGTFRGIVAELVENDVIATTRAEADRLDRLFRDWLEAIARERWLSPEAQRAYLAARARATACFSIGNLLSGIDAIAEMMTFDPSSPTGPLYAGDLFYRIGHPLVALDYYLLAAQAHRKRPEAEYATRILARLADAYERIGHVDEATALYREIADVSPEHPDVGLTWVRAALKAEHYERLAGAGMVVGAEAVHRTNEIIWEEEEEKKTQLTTGDLESYRTALETVYGRARAKLAPE